MPHPNYVDELTATLSSDCDDGRDIGTELSWDIAAPDHGGSPIVLQRHWHDFGARERLL
jgi:hypothetical protein